jgi:hypothetical protein
MYSSTDCTGYLGAAGVAGVFFSNRLEDRKSSDIKEVTKKDAIAPAGEKRAEQCRADYLRRSQRRQIDPKNDILARRVIPFTMPRA